MRRIVGIILLVILALVILIPLGGYFWLRTSLPLTSGMVRVDGLDGRVEIVRDRWGVPHIYASTDHDAMFGLGYLYMMLAGAGLAELTKRGGRWALSAGLLALLSVNVFVFAAMPDQPIPGRGFHVVNLSTLRETIEIC